MDKYYDVNLQDASKSIEPRGAPFSIPNWAYYIEKGEGAPVILVHGLAASLHDWEMLMPELASAGYHSYALDLLGHGDSPKLQERSYKIKWVLRHLERWIDSLALTEPPVIIGHSLGGYLTLRYALRHPERTRALVLVNPFYSLDQLSYILRSTYRRPALNALIIEHLPGWVFQIAVDFTSQALGRIGDGIQYLPDEIRLQTALDYKRTHPGAFNIPNSIHDLTSKLSQIKQPTLVAWGTHDQTLRPDSFKPLVEVLPNAKGATLRAGHVPHQSNPEEFNKKVLAFLNSLQ